MTSSRDCRGAAFAERPMSTIDIEPLHGWTEQQLAAIPHVGKVELVHGKIVMSPASFDHGFVTGIILSRMLNYVLEHNLGVVVDSSTGFRLKKEDLLSPDVSFVAAARLLKMQQPMRRFFRGSPDLAVEVLSPSDGAPSWTKRLPPILKTIRRSAGSWTQCAGPWRCFAGAVRSRCFLAMTAFPARISSPGSFSNSLTSSARIPDRAALV